MRHSAGRARGENNMDYTLPNSHAKYKSNRYLTSWKLEKQGRGTHIDNIFEDAKKKGHDKIAPTSYTHTGTAHYDRTTKRGIGAKSEKRTFVDTILKEEKSKKGPSDYSPAKKIKVPGVYTYNEKRGREFQANLAS